MTDPTLAPSLPRPAATHDGGPDDDTFYDLVEARLRRLVRDNPILGTAIGLHALDDELGDGGREAVLAELVADRRHLTEIEAIDPAHLSAAARFERDLELHNVRRAVFDTDVLRIWERRSYALDTIGDGLFLLFARDHAPLAERLEAITGRLEGVSVHLEQARTRATVPQVRTWQDIELETAADLPGFFDEIAVAADGTLAGPERRRLDRAIEAAKVAVELYATWLEGTLAGGTDDWPVGRERHDALVTHRAFDGLDADDILELGWQKLAEEKTARVAAAREVDPDASEAEVVDRIKSDQPADFVAALEAYRTAMLRSRAHLIEYDLVTVPADERIDVIETPEYLRNVMPFAAYFSPPKFGASEGRKGLYVVTPSVGNDPGAMREHNYASIFNTSIHEAYPGHHQQLAAAITHPSLVRLLVDAPEFVEGWAMYCEQMMREEGFDTAPEHMLMMYTDTIWRACRIILDIKLHRGDVSVSDAVDFLVDQTGFERPNAAAEVNRYTYTPTYQLSYLLGKVLLLRLRDDERHRLGDQFSLRAFHDAMLREGSLPISFHRRLLAQSVAS